MKSHITKTWAFTGRSIELRIYCENTKLSTFAEVAKASFEALKGATALISPTQVLKEENVTLQSNRNGCYLGTTISTGIPSAEQTQTLKDLGWKEGKA
jgi:hypothetical protein